MLIASSWGGMGPRAIDSWVIPSSLLSSSAEAVEESVEWWDEADCWVDPPVEGADVCDWVVVGAVAGGGRRAAKKAFKVPDTDGSAGRLFWQRPKQAHDVHWRPATVQAQAHDRVVSLVRVQA